MRPGSGAKTLRCFDVRQEKKKKRNSQFALPRKIHIGHKPKQSYGTGKWMVWKRNTHPPQLNAIIRAGDEHGWYKLRCCGERTPERAAPEESELKPNRFYKVDFVSECVFVFPMLDQHSGLPESWIESCDINAREISVDANRGDDDAYECVIIDDIIRMN